MPNYVSSEWFLYCTSGVSELPGTLACGADMSPRVPAGMNRRWLQAIYEQLKGHFSELTWDGTGTWRVSGLPNPPNCSVVVSIQSNGTTFVASQVELPWLSKASAGTSKIKLVAPI